MEDDIKRILQDKLFHLQLKSEQKEIIQNVFQRKDSMAVLPTGFGKSTCYVPPPSLRWFRRKPKCCSSGVWIFDVVCLKHRTYLKMTNLEVEFIITYRMLSTKRCVQKVRTIVFSKSHA